MRQRMRQLRAFDGVPSLGRPGAAGAFTLVELLVVIGIIALLITILLPTLSQAREQAKRTQCGAGLHNLGIAFNVYANENKRKLPQHMGAGNNWLWDIPIETRDQIIKAGAVRDSFYCPSGDLQNNDTLWNFNGWCVTGYYFLTYRLNGPLAGPGNFLQYPVGFPDDPFRKLRRRVDVPRASEVELVTDATLSRGVPPNRFFTGVNGGFPSHRSNHLTRHNQAAGGQVLFLDGHVDWRNFRDMRVRFQPGHDEWF